MLVDDLLFAGGTRYPGFMPVQLAQGSSVVVPADVSSFSCILHGRGGNGANDQGSAGGGGGGGGAWGRIHDVPLTPGETISVTTETISSVEYTTVRINGTAIFGVERGDTANSSTGGFGGNQFYRAGRASGISWNSTANGQDGTNGANVSYHSGGLGGNSGNYPSSTLSAAGGIGAESTGNPATAGGNYGGGGGGGGQGGSGAAGGPGRLVYQFNGNEIPGYT